MPFGGRSYWLQPWRSSLTTRPASALTGALGMNFNVAPDEAQATAELLAASGVKRARIEVGWDSMSYADPSQVADSATFATYFTAFRDNGIRPLILLNANAEEPTPILSLNLTLTAPAAQGATTVTLDSTSTAQVVPGLTGFNTTDGYPLAAGDLITGVGSGGVATLSRPLPMSLPAGPAAASTLRYAPFAPPYLADGSPNPVFEQTVSGWLTYVKGVCDLAKQDYGSDDFDVEVWNELTFGSEFLDESYYYRPVHDRGTTGDISSALMQRTVEMLQNPANGLTDVNVGDGFSNVVPWYSGSSVPPGTAAIDHHPYENLQVTPLPFNGLTPIDALGQPDASSPALNHVQDVFAPTYAVFMPEYYLTGLPTETLMRDLSPIPESIYGLAHDSQTHPVGSAPPANWITEASLDPGQAESEGMPAADVSEFMAKQALRYYVSYASEGVQAIDLYAAKSAPGFVPPSFFSAVDADPTSYPASLGGLPMQAVGRLVSTMDGSQPIAQPRQLTLTSIASDNDTDVQFTGNGTAAEPSLYNRDVLTFFPFQVSPNKFVCAVYVMTSNLAQFYTADPAPGQTSYDLPPENFRLTIGNVNGQQATVSLTDPLTGTSEPAAIVSRNASQIVVQLQATDSPRMLTIDDAPTGTGKPVVLRVGTKSPILQLNVDRDLSERTMLTHGIPLTITCGHSCLIQIKAVGLGRRRSRVIARTVKRGRSGRVSRIVLRISEPARAWLRANDFIRIRITARAGGKAIVVKTVLVTTHRPLRTSLTR